MRGYSVNNGCFYPLSTPTLIPAVQPIEAALRPGPAAVEAARPRPRQDFAHLRLDITELRTSTEPRLKTESPRIYYHT
jgi:hypothetical protein